MGQEEEREILILHTEKSQKQCLKQKKEAIQASYLRCRDKYQNNALKR